MSLQLTIRADFAGVQRSLDRLQADVAQQATARALNRTVDQAKSAMSREIRDEFNLPKAKVDAKLRIRRATFKAGRLGLEAVLSSSDPSGKRRAINIINFGARQTKGGLSFKIKRAGGRRVRKDAFIGNKGRTAFKRVPGTVMAGRASSKGLQHRQKIEPLQTIDVPQMFNTKRINAKVVAFIRRKFPEIAEREIGFYVSRFNSAR